MPQYVKGKMLSSWKEATTLLKEEDAVFVQWPGEHKLCTVKIIRSNSIIVETPNKGLMEITNPKSMRIAQDREDLLRKHGAPF